MSKYQNANQVALLNCLGLKPILGNGQATPKSRQLQKWSKLPQLSYQHCYRGSV